MRTDAQVVADNRNRLLAVAAIKARSSSPEAARKRFDKKFDAVPIAGCWLWNGCVDHAGYGKFGMFGRIESSHRAAWQFYRGPIPDGLFVCHRCDVPSCVNPAHLFLGTHKDNVRDCDEKGRRPKGEDRPETVFTAAQVVEMRRLFASGVSQKEIARIFDSTIGHVWAIVRRKIWRHLP